VRWTVSVLIVTHYFLKLIAKNYNNMFEFVKVVVQNTVNLNTVKLHFR